MPQRMAIESGFVVAASGAISSQCDVVIYDQSVTPSLQNENRQRFFPVESVCAVGEVKSVLSLADAKAALLKLASIKFLRECLHEPIYVHCTKEEGLASRFEPQRDERDQMLTFLLCEAFSFNIADNLEELLSCYVQDHPKRPTNLRHNLILSIRDGLLAYLHPSGALFQFPQKSTALFSFSGDADQPHRTIESRRMTNRLVLPPKGSFEHIRHFSTMLHQGLATVSVLFPDMGLYIQPQEDVFFIDLEPIL